MPRHGGDVRHGHPGQSRQEDRALQAATCWCLNLTLRQVALLSRTLRSWPAASSIAGALACHLAGPRAAQRYRPHRRRDPRVHPRPQHRCISMALPVLDEHAGRDRRRLPPDGGGRLAAVRESQRLPGIHGARSGPGSSWCCGHRRRQMPRHRPVHPAPLTARRDASQPAAGWGECRLSPRAGPDGTRPAGMEAWGCRTAGSRAGGVHQPTVGVATAHNLVLTGWFTHQTGQPPGGPLATLPH